MRQSLDIIAGILSDGHDGNTYPWWQVTYRDSMTVRIALTDRYKAASGADLWGAELRGADLGETNLGTAVLP